MFKNGWKSVTGAERSGRPSTSSTGEKQEDATTIILAERRLTTDEIELQLGFSQDTVYSLVRDIFGFSKISVKWVPKHLTEEYKPNRQDICCSLLRCNREGDNFLNGIITGVEARIHHYETGTKRQNMQWKHTSFSSFKTFKSLPSAGRLTVFWNSQRPILEYYMERGTIVISVNYCDMLRNELRPAIRTNWRGRLSQGVVSLHNERPHTTHFTINTTGQPNSEVLGHPAYSPALDPSDYHSFGPLKNALRSCRFLDNDEVKEAVHQSFVIKQKHFFLQWHQEAWSSLGSMDREERRLYWKVTVF